MHTEALRYVQQAVRTYGPFRRVVELGGRNINGTVRHLFARAAAYTAVDLIAGPGVDVVADAAEYVPVRPPDCVVCCEVLEHTRKAEEIVANAHRMLVPGGVLILTTAINPRAPHSGIDGGAVQPDEYYHNVTETALRLWLQPFSLSVIEVDRTIGDIRAVARRGVA